MVGPNSLRKHMFIVKYILYYKIPTYIVYKDTYICHTDPYRMFITIGVNAYIGLQKEL